MTYVLTAEAAPVWRTPAGPLVPWRKLRRALWVALGLVLMAVSAAAVFVPGHFLAVALGLGIVLRNSMSAKRIFLKLQRRKPNWVYPIRRLMRRKPEIAPVFWQGMLRIERLLLCKAKSWRLLKRGRRALKRALRSKVSIYSDQVFAVPAL